MEESDSLGWMSLALTLVVGTIALLLAIRLWWERRTRDDRLGHEDRKHFLAQDLRRGAGILLMGILAAGIHAGARTPTFVVEPDEPALRSTAHVAAGAVVQASIETHPNRRFVVAWLGISATVGLLLVLALFDWGATRRYARRHRRAMNDARRGLLESLRDAGRPHDGLANGRS